MKAQSAYTRRQWGAAVNLCATLSWFGICLLLFTVYVGSLLDFLVIMLFVTLFGLPISLFVGWIIAAPILKHIMLHTISWRRAGLWGGVISSTIALVFICFGRGMGYLQSINPNSHSQLGGGDKIRSIDGILTPYGWQILAQTTGFYILGGIIVALIVRAIIGPGVIVESRSLAE